jgi:hypothetical protein
MKNKLFFAALMLILAAALVKAQASGPNKEIVALPDGGFVSFKNQSTWSQLRQAFDMRQLPAALTSQTLADQNQIVHRVLRDRDGRFVFGYDLWISGNSSNKQFSVVVRPLAAELASSLSATELPRAETVSTFPKSTEPQTLADGAEFSLDLLINKTTGVKIVDVVKVSFDRSSLGGDNPGLRARDFTADAVAMDMKDYSLLVDDELIATGKSKTGSSGALLWLYVPGRGRFIFSLVPRPDYGFEKAGTVSANKIQFSVRGNHYEWLSSSPILHEEGTWNLWVLSDPKYVPMIGPAMAPPPKEKGTFDKVADKLDDKLNAVVEKTVTVQTPSPLKTTLQTPSASQKPSAPTSGALVTSMLNRMENNRERLKVMYGAADKIENLLPRN